MSECVFCDIPKTEPKEVLIENELFYAKYDLYPDSPGHALIIPKAHIVSFFELTEDEVKSMYSLARQTYEIIEKEFKPDACNLGVNNGIAAGRTIHHLHLHIIPRYTGDVDNPTGGVRHVIPDKADYTQEDGKDWEI